MDFVGTPGLTTTNSIWSSNQLGASPGNKPTPSSFSASASAFHFSSGFESLSATVAPRFAKNFAQAIPLRAAPITRTFLPFSSKQSHVQFNSWQTAAAVGSQSLVFLTNIWLPPAAAY